MLDITKIALAALTAWGFMGAMAMRMMREAPLDSSLTNLLRSFDPRQEVVVSVYPNLKKPSWRDSKFYAAIFLSFKAYHPPICPWLIHVERCSGAGPGL